MNGNEEGAGEMTRQMLMPPILGGGRGAGGGGAGGGDGVCTYVYICIYMYLATSCVDRRATDAPDAAPLTGRLQELGAQHRARILPGALTLALASRAPPRLSWSTTVKRG